MYNINHHGDGRVALNLVAPKGAAAALVRIRPRVYFSPAYVGPRGWLGIELDKGLAWDEVCEHVCEAYSLVAPAELVRAVSKQELSVRPPSRKFRPEEVDRFQSKPALARAEAVGGDLRAASGNRAGFGVWQSCVEGRREDVCRCSLLHGAAEAQFLGWSCAAEQLAKDSRFEISRYTGHNGWIDLDIESKADWKEIEPLVVESYRHFALKRMLKEFDKM